MGMTVTPVTMTTTEYVSVYNNYKLLNIVINIKDTVYDNNTCFGQVR